MIMGAKILSSAIIFSVIAISSYFSVRAQDYNPLVIYYVKENDPLDFRALVNKFAESDGRLLVEAPMNSVYRGRIVFSNSILCGAAVPKDSVRRLAEKMIKSDYQEGPKIIGPYYNPERQVDNDTIDIRTIGNEEYHKSKNNITLKDLELLYFDCGYKGYELYGRRSGDYYDAMEEYLSKKGAFNYFKDASNLYHPQKIYDDCAEFVFLPSRKFWDNIVPVFIAMEVVQRATNVRVTLVDSYRTEETQECAGLLKDSHRAHFRTARFHVDVTDLDSFALNARQILQDKNLQVDAVVEDEFLRLNAR